MWSTLASKWKRLTCGFSWGFAWLLFSFEHCWRKDIFPQIWWNRCLGVWGMFQGYVEKFLEKNTSSEINSEFSTSDAQVFVRARCQDSRQEVNPEWYKVGPRADRYKWRWWPNFKWVTGVVTLLKGFKKLHLYLVGGPPCTITKHFRYLKSRYVPPKKKVVWIKGLCRDFSDGKAPPPPQNSGAQDSSILGRLLAIYNNWKIDGTVPAYWFIRTLGKNLLASVPSILTLS